MPHFRPGTVDESLWNSMAAEYPSVPKLEAHDVVLDLGAHIGSFARYAFDQGSRRIYSFEADKDNFNLAVKNLQEYIDPHYRDQPAGVVECPFNLWNLAVVRSDFRQDDPMYFGGYGQIGDTVNTGGGSIFGRNDGFGKNNAVQTIPLDEILKMIGNVKVMKIDIEGSEWPVLFTSRLLSADTIERIVGEYHLPIDESAFRSKLGLRTLCIRDSLVNYLADSGYTTVTMGEYNVPHYQMFGQKIGPFSATR